MCKGLRMLVLTLLLTIGFAIPSWATVPQVVVNGQKLQFDTSPIVENGRVMVPFRFIFESLGAEVSFDEKDNSVIGKKNGKTVKFVIGSSVHFVNEVPKIMDTPAKNSNSRIMVPLRVLSESLGYSVDFNGSIISISSDGQQENVITNDSYAFTIDRAISTLQGQINQSESDCNKAISEAKQRLEECEKLSNQDKATIKQAYEYTFSQHENDAKSKGIYGQPAWEEYEKEYYNILGNEYDSIEDKWEPYIKQFEDYIIEVESMRDEFTKGRLESIEILQNLKVKASKGLLNEVDVNFINQISQ